MRIKTLALCKYLHSGRVPQNHNSLIFNHTQKLFDNCTTDMLTKKTTHMKKTIKIFSAILLFTFLTAGITFGQNTNTGKMKDKESGMVEKVKMKDGKMMMKVDKDWVTMDKDMTLGNGTMVMTNGTVKTKDGVSVKLMEGDCVDEDGKIYDKNKKIKGAQKDQIKEHNKEVKEEKKEERKRD
jgi:hypothetical protein